MHVTLAGSGFHFSSVPHNVLILPAGTNPGLHKNISATSNVFKYVSIEPYPETVVILQLTGKKKTGSKYFIVRDKHEVITYRGGYRET